MFKTYLSRAQTRAWSSEMPVGDPTGGPAYGERNDPVTAAIGVGGSLLSGLMASDSASNAASTAADASTAGTLATVGEQRRQFDINQANMQPWLTAGTESVNRLRGGLMPGGEFGAVRPFNFQYDQNADPGVAFRMSEGMKALERSAAARGGLLSGSMLKGAQRFGQDLASQEYQNAYNRYLTGFNAATGERNALYNRLAGVAGTGQTAASQIGAQGAAAASNIGNALMSNAATQGNAAMAAAGLRSSAYGGTANMLGNLYGRGAFGNVFNTPPYGYQNIAQSGSLGYINPITYGENYG